MVKIIKHIIFLSLISMSYAKTTKLKGPEILKCLGQEELYIHKNKIHNHRFFLNQEIINKVAEFNDVDLKPFYLKKICTKKSTEQHPNASLNLLKYILIKGSAIFEIKLNVDKEHLRAYLQKQIDEFEETMPHLFFKYLGKIQTKTEYPNCLASNIKELAYFTERLYYLEENLSTKNIMDEPKKLNSLFDKLNNMNVIIKGCTAVHTKEKKRLRKIASEGN